MIPSQLQRQHNKFYKSIRETNNELLTVNKTQIVVNRLDIGNYYYVLVLALFMSIE